MLNETKTDKIRRLNDCFRRNMVIGGTVLLTRGVASLESELENLLPSPCGAGHCVNRHNDGCVWPCWPSRWQATRRAFEAACAHLYEKFSWWRTE